MKKTAGLIFFVAALFLDLPCHEETDDYPARYKNYAKDTVIDEWNFYNRECTSFVAWRLNSRNGVKFNNQYAGVNRWGHAKDWGMAAERAGIPVNDTPP